ncbi:MAG: 3-oxoacyl carrier protein reductase [candidate division TM6 bacterium GW2011_GWF2_37_49]|nr:MAG: 3-oxoacyl carrier protein reductase [candidate division TM6 bacterium GW2011_GWF2_37_49]
MFRGIDVGIFWGGHGMNCCQVVVFVFCLLFTNICAKNKAIVVGATSGMGRQVAKLLAQDYEVGLVGRRLNLLESLQAEIPTKSYIKQIDVTEQDAAIQKLSELIEEMGGLDLIVISISAANDIKGQEGFEVDKKILAVDLTGFWIMAETALAFFEKQKSGHLVGISSTSGLRGCAACPFYSGAKAFISRYLEGVRNKIIQSKLPIYVTDIIPGWVEIEAEDVHKIPGAYWVATTQKAAQQIYDAIKAKKKKAYITKRWQLIAWLYDITPDFIYNAVGGF